MSNPNIEKFTAAIAADPVLQGKLQAIDTAAAEDQAHLLAALSVEAGVPIGAADFLHAWSAGNPRDTELSEDDLASVAGGTDSQGERVKLILPRHLIKLTPFKHPGQSTQGD